MMAYETRLFVTKGVVDKDHRFLWPFCLCFLYVTLWPKKAA